MKIFSQKEPFATEDGLITPKNKNLYWAFGLVAGSWIICLFISGVMLVTHAFKNKSITETAKPHFSQFTSESEFRNYVNQAQTVVPMMMGIGASDMMTKTAPAELPQSATVTTPERVSGTNVQVAGVDEPDIVKTDGTAIFVSSKYPQYYFKRVMPLVEPAIGIMPPAPNMQNITDIIQALPVSSMKNVGSVNANGDLLVTNNRLLVLEHNAVKGFDISDKIKPTQAWEYSLDSNRQIETARLVGGQVVLVTKMYVYPNSPCPMPLWKMGNDQTTIPCTEIWRPDVSINADGVYTVVSLDPTDGHVNDMVSFVGGQDSTTVYVSPDAVYIGFTTSMSQSELLAHTLLSPDNSLIDAATKARITKVLALDISQAAKEVEIDQIVSGYTNNLSDDERMKWQTEMTNLMDAYIETHKREIEQTVITKIAVDEMRITATGEVPGRLLNQFSMDEYQDYLRLATTVGGRGFGNTHSANDVYVLDSKLNQVGRVTDLGKEERVYAVRFMNDRGFVVTFKETDPLYTLDLSDPKAPKVTGELKIPGYSSYLHPLQEHVLLGVGKEDNRVKVSLFDVSDPTSPKTLDTYLLSDYWSDIQSTHHAFLQDAKHGVFFIPASQGGYIFSYNNNSLKLVKTVADTTIDRALYINDALYLIGDHKITVVSEINWEVLSTFKW